MEGKDQNKDWKLKWHLIFIYHLKLKIKGNNAYKILRKNDFQSRILYPDTYSSLRAE